MRWLRIKNVVRAVLDLLFPRICPVCGRTLLVFEEELCIDCLCEVPYTHYWDWERNPMADKFNFQLNKLILPGESEPYAYATALIFYNDLTPYRNIPLRLKYHSDVRLGRYFARELGKRAASSPLFADVDMIIPVPLHWTRKWKRGYNQSEVISRAVSEMTGAPVRTDILYRRRRTRTQTRLEVKEKEANVRDAFTVRRRDVAPKHILLVDDTFTTGATLSACQRALRAIFLPSVRISVITLAYVGEY